VYDTDPQTEDHSTGIVTHHLIEDDLSSLPLHSQSEAFLFRHYVQKIAISLDVCDPHRHFEQAIPRLARRSRTLLNAMFALAARHLSQTSSYDQYASNRYHDECLRHLIPRLSEPSAVTDETLFAATIILRMLEEFDGKRRRLIPSSLHRQLMSDLSSCNSWPRQPRSSPRHPRLCPRK
jgi:hypothetical protein